MRALGCLMCLCAASAGAEVWVVDTASDSSLSACTVAIADCSLRGAMQRANATLGADSIHFNIPTSDVGYSASTDSWQIAVGSVALPPIDAPVVINGYTQPSAIANTLTPADGGLNGVLKIEVRGISAARLQQNGLEVNGNFFSHAASSFRGLAINGFGTQILLHGNSAHRVEGCYLGTDISGQQARVWCPATNVNYFRVFRRHAA